MLFYLKLMERKQMEVLEHFRFPLKDPDWAKKIAIGSVLSLIPFVGLMSIGYVFSILEDAIKGEEEKEKLPEWGGHILPLFIGGLLVALLFLPAILSLLILHLISRPLELLASFAVSFASPAIASLYAAEGNPFIAYDPRRIYHLIRRAGKDYIIAWLHLIVFLWIVYLVYQLPVIGIIISAFLTFYGLICFSRIFGMLASRAASES